MQFTTKLIPLAIALAFAGAANAQEVIKIGHVGPVSGAQAHYGRDNENGARMAVEELNTQGVKIGGKAVKFDLEKTGWGWKTIEKVEPYVSALPTTCQMKRPG